MMGIECNDLLEGLWFIAFDNSPEDWMGGLSRSKTKEGCFELLYRHRYYVDEDLTSKSKDRKSWYRATFGPCDLNEALSRMAMFVGVICKSRPGQMWKCLRRGRTTDEMMEEWASMPFCHREQVTAEEYEKIKRGEM